MDALLMNDLSRLQEYQIMPNWNPTNTYIYGAGKFAQDIQRVLEQHGADVSGFIDHRKREGKTINNLPLYHPDDPNINPEQRRNSVVVLGIHNREVNILTIVEKLKTLGYKNIASPIDLYDYFANELGTRYWLTSRTYYSSHISEIKAAYDLLSDKKSRETFVSQLRFRITGDYSFLPEPDLEHQYFPLDIHPSSQLIRLVDCGAYDGDTLQSLLHSGFEFQAIAAFEPDQDNFRKLSTYVSQNRDKFPNASLFPCGVYSSTTQLIFDMGKGEATAASLSGSNTVQCVSLDESIPTFQPTLIKMDIEGVEMDAIRGAEQTVKEYQPVLAISAYHTPAHIWEIPLLINGIAQENQLQYTYHFRSHAHNCFDTVFYAIPKRQFS